MTIEDYNNLITHLIQTIGASNFPPNEYLITNMTQDELDKQIEEEDADLFANMSNRESRLKVDLWKLNDDKVDGQRTQYFWLKLSKFSANYVTHALKNGHDNQNIVRNLAFMRRAFNDIKRGLKISALTPNNNTPDLDSFYGAIPLPKQFYDVKKTYNESRFLPMIEYISNNSESMLTRNTWESIYSALDQQLSATFQNAGSQAATYRYQDMLIYLHDGIEPNETIKHILFDCCHTSMPYWKPLKAIVISQDSFGGYLVSAIGTGDETLHSNLGLDQNKSFETISPIEQRTHSKPDDGKPPLMNSNVAKPAHTDNLTNFMNDQVQSNQENRVETAPEDQKEALNDEDEQGMSLSDSGSFTDCVLPSFAAHNQTKITPTEVYSEFEVYKNYYAVKGDRVERLILGSNFRIDTHRSISPSQMTLRQAGNRINVPIELHEIVVDIQQAEKKILVSTLDSHHPDKTRSLMLSFDELALVPSTIDMNHPDFKEKIIDAMTRQWPDLGSTTSGLIACTHYGILEATWSPLFTNYLNQLGKTASDNKLEPEVFLRQIADFSALYIQVMPCLAGSAAIGEWLIHGLAALKGLSLENVQQNQLSWDFSAFSVLSFDEFFDSFKRYFHFSPILAQQQAVASHDHQNTSSQHSQFGFFSQNRGEHQGVEQKNLNLDDAENNRHLKH